MRQRREFPGGRPLPRRASGTEWNRWLAEIVEGHALSYGRRRGDTTRDRLDALADALHFIEDDAAASKREGGVTRNDRTVLAALCRGTKGVSPTRAYAIGEALWLCGVPWCSGLLSLSVEPAYEPHVLGALGYLFAAGPTPELKTLWPFVRRVVADPDAAFVGTRPLDITDLARESDVTLLESGHKALKAAWRKWWNSEFTDNFPSIIKVTIELSRSRCDDEIEAERAAIDTHKHLVAWVDSIPARWDDLGRFLRVKRRDLAFSRPRKRQNGKVSQAGRLE